MEELLMQKTSDQGRLRPWMGIILFGVLMAFMLFIASPLQLNYGIPGLVLTEIGFLALAAGYCFIRKVKISEVFPVKKIKLREFFGSILIVLGSYPLSMILVFLTAMIFPSSAKEIGELNSFVYDSLNYPLAVLIIALLPAICEEAIHRGAILSNFRSLKHDWVFVLIMGLMFGINHLSVLRFLTTMFLGLLLSFVVVKRNNILLSMLMHFTNNFISVSLAYLTGNTGTTSTANIDFTVSFGLYLILGFLSPVVITLGVMLVNPESHKKIRFLYAGILATVMLFSGSAITVVKFSHNMLLNTTVGYEVTEENEHFSMIDFNVEEERNATVVVTLLNAEGNYRVSIDGDKGSNIINAEIPEGQLRTISYNVELQADHYTVNLYTDDDSIGECPNFQIVVQ